MYFQQGDVLLTKFDFTATGLTKLNHGTLVFGVATGHHHTLFDGEYEQYENSETKDRYVRIVTPCNLKHQEHKTIPIDVGLYKISIVREYDHFSEEIRNVQD